MITLDGFQVAGGILIWTALVWLAVGVAHQVGLAAEATSVPVSELSHERCEGCGRDTCAHDPNQLTTCPGTVMWGCAHQRVLCTDCMAECSSCRADAADAADDERYVWGDSR